MPVNIPDDNLTYLTEWLCECLAPLSAADAATLAEYVIALLRHDSDGDELRQHCTDELRDFLSENTDSFVEDLFRAIEDESYMSAANDRHVIGNQDDDFDDHVIGGHRRQVSDDLDYSPRDRRSSRRRSDSPAPDDLEDSRKRRRDSEDGSSSANANVGGGGGAVRDNYRDSRNQQVQKAGTQQQKRHNTNPSSSYRGGGGARGDGHDDRAYRPEGYFDYPPMGYPYPPSGFGAGGPMMPGGMPMMGMPPPGMFMGMGMGMGMPPFMGMGPGFGFGQYPGPNPYPNATPPPVTRHGDGPRAGYPPAGPPGGRPLPPSGPRPTGGLNPNADSWSPGGPGQHPYHLQHPSSFPNHGPRHSQQYPPASQYPPRGPSSFQQRQQQQQQQQHQYSQPSHLQCDMPESERFTLKVVGIPADVTEEALTKHFKTFGRVVIAQLQDNADGRTTENECLVQFATLESAKKCVTSRQIVLGNSQIRVKYADFNIFPAGDVPEMTEEEEAEEAEREAAETAAAPAGGYPRTKSWSLHGGTATGGSGYRPKPVARFTNKKFVAGQPETVTAAKLTPAAAASAAGSTASLSTSGVGTPRSVDASSEAGADSAAASETPEGDEASAAEDNSLYADLNTSQESASEQGRPAVSTGLTPPPGYRKSTSTAPAVKTPAEKKSEMALQSKYEELRRLRAEEEIIWKKKETLLQSQIVQYKLLISKMESNSDAVDGLETKIMNAQSQLQAVKEQREKSLQNQNQAAAQLQASAYSSGPGRFGGRRFNAPSYGRGDGGRGRGRGGRGGRGPPFRAANLSMDNRPKAIKFTQPSEALVADGQQLFSKYGNVRVDHNASDNSMTVSFDSRAQAEAAKAGEASTVVQQGLAQEVAWAVPV